jgi:hypothetical protein
VEILPDEMEEYITEQERSTIYRGSDFVGLIYFKDLSLFNIAYLKIIVFTQENDASIVYEYHIGTPEDAFSSETGGLLVKSHNTLIVVIPSDKLKHLMDGDIVYSLNIGITSDMFPDALQDKIVRGDFKATLETINI